MNTINFGTKNSHKYFPEFMIRAFYGKKTVNYLDAKSGQTIMGPKSNNFNARIGWYSDVNEEILNKEAEQQFQQLSIVLNKKAKRKNRDFSKFKMDPDVVYRFFAYQLIRDPTYSKVLLDELTARGGIKSPRKLLLQEFQNEAIKLENAVHSITGALKEVFAVVLEPNFTDSEYIAVNVPVMVNFTDGNTYILAVSPRVAFCLVSWGLYDNLSLGLVRDDGSNFVFKTNERIMAHAIAHEPHEVLGRNSEYLKMIHQDTKSKIIGWSGD
jgi:hypothetical protein